MSFDRRSMLITSWEMWLCKWINLLATIQYPYFIVHIEQWQIEIKWKCLFLYISYRWHPYISVSLHNFYRHRIQIKWLCKLWHFLALAPTAGIVFYMMLLYRTSDKILLECLHSVCNEWMKRTNGGSCWMTLTVNNHPRQNPSGVRHNNMVDVMFGPLDGDDFDIEQR